MSNSQNMNDALHDLVRRIKDGGEFPDVAWVSAGKFGVNQAELEAAYDALDQEEEEQADYEATCPKCGGHDFRMDVLQSICVQFGSTGDHDVYAGPNGDMEFDEDTGAICNGCFHYAPLGEMKATL